MKACGKCLCGSVELEVELSNTEVGACHCNMCRKWSGAPMMAIDCGDSLKISDESLVSRYESSEWAESKGVGLTGILKPDWSNYQTTMCFKKNSGDNNGNIYVVHFEGNRWISILL